MLTLQNISIAACALSAASASASSIVLDNIVYETVNWTGANAENDVAYGFFAGKYALLRASDVTSNDVDMFDYAGVEPYNALDFSGADSMMTSVQIDGQSSGSSTLFLGVEVQSILIIVGTPEQSAVLPQYSSSQWDFADGLDVETVDSEGGLIVEAGNVTLNVGEAQAGVFRATAAPGESFSSLTWAQLPDQGVDDLNITFAIAQTIPAPVSAASLAVLGFGRRRR